MVMALARGIVALLAVVVMVMVLVVVVVMLVMMLMLVVVIILVVVVMMLVLMVVLVMLIVLVVMMVMLMLVFFLIMRMACFSKDFHFKVVLSFHNLQNLLTWNGSPVGCNNCCIRIQLLNLFYTELQLLRSRILATA